MAAKPKWSISGVAKATRKALKEGGLAKAKVGAAKWCGVWYEPREPDFWKPGIKYRSAVVEVFPSGAGSMPMFKYVIVDTNGGYEIK